MTDRARSVAKGDARYIWGRAEAVNMKLSARPGRVTLSKALIALTILMPVLFLTACNFDLGGEQKYPEPRQRGDQGPVYGDRETIFGQGGLLNNLNGESNPNGPDNGASGGVGVNSLLWRASLDTISFMPLISADPFGGVIITDWYTPPQTPDERFKVNIYILGRALRADGVRASVFRQTNQGGSWVDSPVALNTGTDLENAILTRARQMRMSGQQQ
jgi:hypothetical protein